MHPVLENSFLFNFISKRSIETNERKERKERKSKIMEESESERGGEKTQ